MINRVFTADRRISVTGEKNYLCPTTNSNVVVIEWSTRSVQNPSKKARDTVPMLNLWKTLFMFATFVYFVTWYSHAIWIFLSIVDNWIYVAKSYIDQYTLLAFVFRWFEIIFLHPIGNFFFFDFRQFLSICSNNLLQWAQKQLVCVNSMYSLIRANILIEFCDKSLKLLTQRIRCIWYQSCLVLNLLSLKLCSRILYCNTTVWNREKPIELMIR